MGLSKLLAADIYLGIFMRETQGKIEDKQGMKATERTHKKKEQRYHPFPLSFLSAYRSEAGTLGSQGCEIQSQPLPAQFMALAVTRGDCGQGPSCICFPLRYWIIPVPNSQGCWGIRKQDCTKHFTWHARGKKCSVNAGCYHSICNLAYWVG